MNDRISQTSTFGGETFISLESEKSGKEASIRLLEDYSELLIRSGLDESSEIFLRFHLSDIAAQAEILRNLLAERNAFYSLIGQPPASGSTCALQAYHIHGTSPVLKTKDLEGNLSVSHSKYKSFWTHCGDRPDAGRSIERQTSNMFGQLSARIDGLGILSKEGLLRTWIYLRNIDSDYMQFAAARRDLYRSKGVKHYPASTAIEGASADPSCLAFMDSLAIAGLDPEQIEYVSAPDNLCHPDKYDITFERGLKLSFGDRTHYYISGTASIDKYGRVLHAGDLEKQAARTLENIEALLETQNAGISDMKILTVYLRNVADFDRADSFLRRNLPANLQYIIVKGKVCRPEWLIEIDGRAVTMTGDKRFAPYC